MMKDNSPKVEGYITNEEVRNALRGIALRIHKDIPRSVFEDLSNIINEDGITEVYLDFMLSEYELPETSDHIDGIAFEHNPFDHGWDC